jgi:hypothetical protein
MNRLAPSKAGCVGAMVVDFSVAAYAAGPGWTANSTVSKLVVTADGGVNVLLDPPLSGCISNSG